MTLRPTRLRLLVILAVAAGAAAYLVAFPVYRHLPRLPRGGAISLALLAAAEVNLAASVRARLAGRPGTRPILPLVVARFAVLARASSAMGALVVGLWIGVAAYLLQHRRDFHPPTVDADLITAAMHVVAALLLVVVALRLERACRAPKPPPAAEDQGPRSAGNR